MSDTIFSHLRFWLLVVFSAAPAVWIYWIAYARRAMSRFTILQLGFTLVVIAGVDVYLLQSLKGLAKFSPSIADDTIFDSEVSIALYLLPAMFCGIGINMVSHVVLDHLVETGRRFKSEKKDT